MVQEFRTSSNHGQGLDLELKSTLIICTRNRREDLTRCLESIRTSNRIPDEILIVDSSDLGFRMNKNELPPRIRDLTRVIFTEPSLTAQRNLGLENISDESQVVHFIDDDVQVLPEYFSQLEFQLNKGQFIGVTGNQINVFNPFLGKSPEPRYGEVMPSGKAIGVYSEKNIKSVEWLPGCSMSFLLSAIEGLKFNELLKGYAIGEDVDFTYKVSMRGHLSYIPMAELKHNMSPTNRIKYRKLHGVEILNRYMFVKTRQGKLRLRSFWCEYFIQSMKLLHKLCKTGHGLGLLASQLGALSSIARFEIHKCTK